MTGKASIYIYIYIYIYISLQVTFVAKLFYHEVTVHGQLMIFFYWKEKLNFILDVSRFLCFCEIHKF